MFRTVAILIGTSILVALARPPRASRSPRPAANGRFEVTLKAPRPDRVYTFRFRTKVRHSTAFTKLFRTYTLPQYVVGT